MQLLIIDYFLRTLLLDWERREFLVVIEGRNQFGAAIIASQSPIDDWHPYIVDITSNPRSNVLTYSIAISQPELLLLRLSPLAHSHPVC